jgi:hypothetical protein
MEGAHASTCLLQRDVRSDRLSQLFLSVGYAAPRYFGASMDPHHSRILFNLF